MHTNMLCSPCETIFQNPVFSRLKATLDPNTKNSYQQREALKADFRQHHQTFTSFDDALNNKCPFCLRLLRGSGPVPLARKIFPNEGGVDPELDLSQFSTSWRLSFETPNKTVLGFVSLVKSRRQGKEWTARAQKPLALPELLPPERSDNNQILTQISSWISSCQSHHSKCRRPPRARVNPQFARIIDLGNRADSTTVRLCKAYELPPDATYMTLSHCWGGATITTLNTANYDRFFESIEMNELPQTFIDAINVTRRLKVRYLWIDSLCIVQDSHMDWSSHVETMGEIYEGSYCNIAASRAKDPYAGIFTNREPVLITPLRISVTGALGENVNGWYDVGDDFAQEWSSQVGNSALGQRAWVVQERLLAPRCVHFAEKQLYWECVEVQSREGDSLVGAEKPNSRNVQVDFKVWDPFERSITLSPNEHSFGADYVWTALRALRSEESQIFTRDMLKTDPKLLAETSTACFHEASWTRSHQLLIYWSGIVRAYSNALLTRLDDRLVAIAGLTKILSERMNGIRYVAGLWSFQLPRQLLSTSIAHIRHNQVIDSYLAPSWSWASNQIGPVTNLRLDDNIEEDGAMDLIKIIKIEVKGKHGEDDPFGEIESGRLRVQGRLIPIELDLSNWPEPNERKSYVLEYWQPSALELPVQETFLLPVLFIRWSGNLPLSTPNALLIEATGQQGVFQRIGTARLSDSYPLNWTTPYLYATKKSMFTATNQESTESEEPYRQASRFATDNDNSTKEPKVLSPRRELQALKLQKALNPNMQDRIDELKGAARKNNKTPAAVQQATQLISVFSSIINRAAHTLPAHQDSQVSKIAASPAEMTKARIEMQLGAEPSMSTQHPMLQPKRPVSTILEAQKLKQRSPRPPVLRPPKEMVAPRFYLEYVEDQSSSRFGNFIFDII